MRILVAEDNAVNQKLIDRALSKLGYEEIHIVGNGAEAVREVDKQFYHVVLMDIQMPKMDGLKATRVIRSMPSQQPFIIAMTANATQDDKAACLAAGMNDYISKPFKLEVLLSALEGAAKLI
jgi:CheY-like chemotaxis protein